MRKRNEDSVHEIIKKLVPERERWRIEIIKIIAESVLNSNVEEPTPITSYNITKKLNESGFNTRVGSVHIYLEDLIKTGLCNRRGFEKTKYKAIRVTKKCIKLWEIFEVTIDNPISDGE